MNKPVLALSLSALATFGWVLPVAHSAPPPVSQREAQPIAVAVDVGALPKAERGVGPVLLEQLRALIGAGGVEIIDAGVGVTLLRVRLRLMEAGDRNYGIHFEFVDGDVVEPAMEWTDCVFCTEARLRQKLDAAAPELLTAIEARQRAQIESAVSTDTGDEDDGGAADDGGGSATDDDGSAGQDGGGVEPASKPIGALGGAGIGVATVGLGVMIAGAAQWSRGQVPEVDLNRRISEGRDYTGQGQLLVGIGVGAVVVGAVMLGVDLGVLAKRRQASDRAQVVPVIGPQQAGIVLRGRF